MKVLDIIYIYYYRWYDRDGIGIKKKDASKNSAFFLGMTLSMWVQFLIFTFLKLTSASLPSNAYVLVWLIILGLCYQYYFYNDRGFIIYHSEENAGYRTLPRRKAVAIMLLLSLLPFALMFVVAAL